MIYLDLCCNDDLGQFTGELHGIEFRDTGGDLLLSLEWLEIGSGLPFTWVVGRLTFLDNAQFVVDLKRGHACGNLYWDSTSTDDDTADELASYLVESGFGVLEACSAPKWNRFFHQERLARAERVRAGKR